MTSTKFRVDQVSSCFLVVNKLTFYISPCASTFNPVLLTRMANTVNVEQQLSIQTGAKKHQKQYGHQRSASEPMPRLHTPPTEGATIGTGTSPKPQTPIQKLQRFFSVTKSPKDSIKPKRVCTPIPSPGLWEAEAFPHAACDEFPEEDEPTHLHQSLDRNLMQRKNSVIAICEGTDVRSRRGSLSLQRSMNAKSRELHKTRNVEAPKAKSRPLSVTESVTSWLKPKSSRRVVATY